MINKAEDEACAAQKEKYEANAPILANLSSYDLKSIHPLRTVLTAMQIGESPNADDIAKLRELEKTAEKERVKII